MSDENPPGICPICKGAGYLIKDVPVGDPEFGQLIPCHCKLNEIEEKRALRLRNLSNLGDNHGIS